MSGLETPTPIPTLPLSGGAEIPLVGLGTWPMDDATAARVVPEALELGYRLIDTAENYENERGVGEGLRASGVPRDQVFVTTKFNVRWHGRDLVARALEESLDRLKLDQVDLLLVHWPNPSVDRYVDAWRGVLDLRAAGRIRAAGVSNFTPAQLGRLLAETGELPELNQIQLSPITVRAAETAFHAEHGVVTQSWSPLGRADAGLLRAAPVVDAARRLGVTPAQVVLRWHVQQGLSVVPKSQDPRRLAQNLALFGIVLTDEEMASISALDRGGEGLTDPMTFGH
jgi:2,5-diketo-D-gluconate reductase A